MTAPSRLGNYELLMELASGGMGVLYVARRAGAAGFERLVVVKRIHDELSFDPSFRKMFRDEARLMSFVHDAHVASVLDVIDAGGRLSLVLEYVESISLAALVRSAKERGERLPIPIVARITSDVLAGLHAAHEARGPMGDSLGLIHRDVSPQNVIVGLDGTTRLIDFGIAKATQQPAGATETQSGILKGKLRYMSPEQVKQVALDRRTDVFSAGVVLYEALTGERMFRNEDDADLLLSLLLGDVRPPRDWVPDISPELEDVVLRAVEREREERFATAADFGEALEGATTLASTRDVARYVEAHSGTELAERRERLRDRAREATEANAAARTKRRRMTMLALGAIALTTASAFGAARALRAKASPASTVIDSASAQPTSLASTPDTVASPSLGAESTAKIGPAHTASSHVPAHATTHTASPNRCSPPYDVLVDGTHRFKPECVR